MLLAVHAGSVMKTAKRIILALALAAGLALAAAPAASAGTYQYYGAESYSNPGTAFVQFNAAHSYNIVSIKSNYVNCPAFNGAHVTWCGTVGNNTVHAQAGVNYTDNGKSYWMREDVYAAAWDGTFRCDTRGNGVSNFVTYCAGVGN